MGMLEMRHIHDSSRANMNMKRKLVNENLKLDADVKKDKTGSDVQIPFLSHSIEM